MQRQSSIGRRAAIYGSWELREASSRSHLVVFAGDDI